MEIHVFWNRLIAKEDLALFDRGMRGRWGVVTVAF
jgi:hypothetical protein